MVWNTVSLSNASLLIALNTEITKNVTLNTRDFFRIEQPDRRSIVAIFERTRSNLMCRDGSGFFSLASDAGLLVVSDADTGIA
jgi:hypothetical protein